MVAGIAHWPSMTSGFPFSAKYVASSAALPLPTFFTAWMRSVRDEQDLAGLERHRRPAVELILQHTFDDVDEFFARMRVPGRGHSRGDIDERLNDLASGDAEIVLA